MNNFSRMMAAAAALAFTANVAAAQSTATPAQTPGAPMTQQQLDEEILKELKAIHQLLERLTTPQAPAPRASSGKLTNLADARVLGRADAPLTMVEFTDLQCPYCRQYASVTFDLIKKNWIDTGKLRYISRDFPLDIHPLAMTAARAARCAGEQGKFWEMRTSLMKNANLLSADYITATAENLKLDVKAFAACTASPKYDADIQAQATEGFRLGVEGTPTFLLGRTQPDSVEGPMIVGALPYALFDAKLKDLESAKQ